MKAETIRRRLAHIEIRLKRDLDALERLFPHACWDGGADATEAMRNLASAVAYVHGLQAMSDFGIEDQVEFHSTPHPPS